MLLKELLKYVGIDLNSGFGGSSVSLEGIDNKAKIRHLLNCLTLVFSSFWWKSIASTCCAPMANIQSTRGFEVSKVYQHGDV